MCESVTIAEVDDHFKPIPGTEKSFDCDSVLIAVGLDPVDEFYHKAQEFGLQVFSAGDAEEIAEASAAMFSGKIKGRKSASALGYKRASVPSLLDPHGRNSQVQTRRQLQRRITGNFQRGHANSTLHPGNPLQSRAPPCATAV